MLQRSTDKTIQKVDLKSFAPPMLLETVQIVLQTEAAKMGI
ncbi:hypothetical protein [Sulfurimonas marina]|nr:hypothetical protein [Sulfurimonas marina]